jgi:hypothetical protein
MQPTAIILCQYLGRAQGKYTTGFETNQINHRLICERNRRKKIKKDFYSSNHAVMMKGTDLII